MLLFGYTLTENKGNISIELEIIVKIVSEMSTCIPLFSHKVVLIFILYVVTGPTN